MKFSKRQTTELLELGLTTIQIDRLNRRLQLIRDSILRYGTKTDVADPLKLLLKHLTDAEFLVGKMVSAKEGALWLAYGYLASGASDQEPQDVCTLIERGNGELPEFVSVPTLLRLITNATDRALNVHVPGERFTPKTPVSAIHEIVSCLDDPTWKVRRGEESEFAIVCSKIFDVATGGKLRSGEPSVTEDKKGVLRPDIDRAIREYLSQEKKNKKPAPDKEFRDARYRVLKIAGDAL